MVRITVAMFGVSWSQVEGSCRNTCLLAVAFESELQLGLIGFLLDGAEGKLFARTAEGTNLYATELSDLGQRA